jgi:RNAse (barnase) inhibitor barstar
LSTKENLIEEFSRHFDFQKGFGKNWDAIYDCLKDEAWGVQQFLVIVILNSEKLLECAEQKDRVFFKEILEDTAKSWAQKIQEGKSWDRQSKSLHILFHVLPVNKGKFLSKFENSDLPELVI